MGPRGDFEALRPQGGLARVFLAAPGERARCLIGGRRKGAREAWLQQVIEPSPHRVEPPCLHYGICGGCTLQHLSSAAQLVTKCAPWLEALAREHPGATLLEPRPAPTPWSYRSKVELTFSREGDLGFLRRGRFDRVVDVQECWIGPPGNRRILAEVRSWAREHGLSGWDPRRQAGLLRHLVLRHSLASGLGLATLVTTSPPEGWPIEALADRLAPLGLAGVIHAVHDSPAGAVRVDRSEVIWGEDRLLERLGPLEFELSWRSFFQSNPPAFAAMLEEARGWIDLSPGARVLDLFCGVGTVGLSLILEGGRLVGVESVPEAVEDARRNAARFGLPGEFHAGPSERWPDLGCDLLVLDPPRSGCHPKLLARLLEGGPERILYISCNPRRLLEELGSLQGAYRLERLRFFDFFPQTAHLEALCLLVREAPG